MSHEGGCVGSYSGCGVDRLGEGTEWECRFELEHHVELGLLLECVCDGPQPSLDISDFQSFRGTTYDGRFVLESSRGGDISSTTWNSEGETIIFVHLYRVTVQRADNGTPTSFRYGITNF